MGREIVNIQAGQAGNQVGESFWNMLIAEHGLDYNGCWIGSDDEQLTRANVYFQEIDGDNGASRFVPRSVQVDLEPGVCDQIRSRPLGTLFRPDTFVAGASGAGNNWAKGFYTEGAELVDTVLDVVRRHAEGCDALQGFQLTHSLGGGTGSGLGTLLTSKIREEFPDRMMCTFSVLPGTAASEVVVEAYNVVFAYQQLIENSDLCIAVDNDALYAIAQNVLHMEQPTYAHINQLVARVMCGTSTSLRFAGLLNGDLRKLAMNLVPFPRLHFLMPSYAPFVDPKARQFSRPSVADLTRSLFDRRSLLVMADPSQGRYLTAATIFRGRTSSMEAEAAVGDLQRRNSDHFVEWIPDNVSVTLCGVPPVGQDIAATCLANSTAIQEVFKKDITRFSAMFRRKAFTHWYTNEGMDEMEFTEAESNAKDLVQEYQQYQEATSADETEEEWEE